MLESASKSNAGHAAIEPFVGVFAVSLTPPLLVDRAITVQESPGNSAFSDAASERAQLAADWEGARTAVFAQLLAGIGSFHDAEDVLQEVAVSVAKNYDSYDPARPFIAWALGITRNHMLMYFRRYHRNRLVFSDQLMAMIGRQLEKLAENPTDQRREALHNCINQLDERQRRLIEMRYSGGLSVNQIAESLEKSVAAVKGSLHRVRKALERCVNIRISKGLQ
jgi:RNA polymerase sigma-70 factor (ECF subfamily)